MYIYIYIYIYICVCVCVCVCVCMYIYIYIKLMSYLTGINVSAAEPNRFILFGETDAVYCENHPKHAYAA
jgi:hypothetical protein